MSKSSRRSFVTSAVAAGAAAFSAVPNTLLANPSAADQSKDSSIKFVAEVGNIGTCTVEETIQYAKDLKMEGLSVPWVRVPGFQQNGFIEAEPVKAIRAKIEDAGLVFHSMMASLPRTLTGTGPDAEKDFGNLRKSLQAMNAAKADLLSAFVPVPRTGPWEDVVSLYRKLMKEFEPAGVRIASHSGGRLNTWAALIQLMKDVPSASNGICYCTGNVWHGEHEKIYDIPAPVAEKIYYIHIRNVKTGEGEKEYWFHEGDIDFRKLVASIRKIGYKGYLRSEHLPTDHYNLPVRQSDVGTAWAQGYMRAIL
jgi:sugar phosphate isomerase/epimerase